MIRRRPARPRRRARPAPGHHKGFFSFWKVIHIFKVWETDGQIGLHYGCTKIHSLPRPYSIHTHTQYITFEASVCLWASWLSERMPSPHLSFRPAGCQAPSRDLPAECRPWEPLWVEISCFWSCVHFLECHTRLQTHACDGC